MNHRVRFFACVLTAGFAMAAGVSAHHGKSSYDDSKVFTIMGRVSSFDFSNPHAEIFLDVKDDKGNVAKWVGEGTSPNMLAREGWNGRTLKPGDMITATGHPARNGSNSLRIEKIVLPSGKELTFEGPGGT